MVSWDILFLRSTRYAGSDGWQIFLNFRSFQLINRCVKPAGFDFISSSQLYYFSDVSETGFGLVFYLRLINGQGAVLRYVKNETRPFHAFVAHGVVLIRYSSEPHRWNHVSGDMNPADDASHRLTADIFLGQGRWLMGPEYLWKPELTHVANADRSI